MNLYQSSLLTSLSKIERFNFLTKFLNLQILNQFLIIFKKYFLLNQYIIHLNRIPLIKLEC
jgi:hypothetical protein